MTRPPLYVDHVLSPDVAVRLWGPTKHMEINWRTPVRGADIVLSPGEPRHRVSGILDPDEIEELYLFLDKILGERVPGALHPDLSHDQDLNLDVSVRWWGPSKNLDITWRSPSRDDRVHPDGTPLVRVSGGMSRDEAVALYRFLGER